METYYPIKNQLNALRQQNATIPATYRNDLNPIDKENIFKDIYSNIKEFYRIVYETKDE